MPIEKSAPEARRTSERGIVPITAASPGGRGRRPRPGRRAGAPRRPRNAAGTPRRAAAGPARRIRQRTGAPRRSGPGSSRPRPQRAEEQRREEDDAEAAEQGLDGRPAPLCRNVADVQEHEDEEEQDEDRARVDDDLDRRDEGREQHDVGRRRARRRPRRASSTLRDRVPGDDHEPAKRIATAGGGVEHEARDGHRLTSPPTPSRAPRPRTG